MKRSMIVLIAHSALAVTLYGGNAHAAKLCKSLQSPKALTMTGASTVGGTTVDDKNAILDGDLKSGATMTPAAGSNTAEATFSGAFARYEGEVAGVALKPSSGQTTVTIATLLDGKPVDSSLAGMQDASGQSCSGVCEARDNQSFFGIKISGPFNQIRVTVQVTGATDSTTVLELCGR